MQKPHITRTLGQIHFEDLEPHRFEDLVRQLIYDYKNWQNIEATGRSGADDGYDIRAYEKALIVVPDPELDLEHDVDVQAHFAPTQGNLWMIQCKREKQLATAKVKKIINDGINAQDPPYGYILAASANISKKTYDTFREELKIRGVMEFYIWGKAELEDMLFLPKNDRILFTFFGISLVSKRQSKTTQMRASVSIKNKLISTLGDHSSDLFKEVLFRDLNDENYPYKEKSENQQRNPGWYKYTVYGFHPLGIVCHVHQYFAFINKEKKEYDFVEAYDFELKDQGDEKLRTERFEFQSLIRDEWELLPKHQQAKLRIDGIVNFNDISLVDPKGDNWNDMPHVFVDYSKGHRPFARKVEFGVLDEHEFVLEGYKRVRYFPETFIKRNYGRIYKDDPIILTKDILNIYQRYKSLPGLYSLDEKYQHLKSKDVVQIIDETGEEKQYWMITVCYNCKLSEHLANYENFHLKNLIMLQIDDKIKDNTKINVYEMTRVFERDFDF